MRNNGIKWVLGTLSAVVVAFTIIMITNHSIAQDDSANDGVNIENVEEMPSADMDTDRTKDCSIECMEKCEKECSPEECEEACQTDMSEEDMKMDC